MKKLIVSALAVGALFAQPNEAIQKQIEELKAKIKQLEKMVQENQQMALENQKKVNPIAANDHLFWNFDLRSTYDFIDYELTNGNKKTNNILANRVRLTAVAKPSDNLKATLQITANNIYGMNGNNNAMILGYDNSNWTASETPDDTNLRVTQAFFNYHFGPDNALMFSAGRRPATEGYPAHFRAGDESPNSPLAHLINMEFDGFSFKIGNEIFANMSETLGDWGTWVKICAGRGYSSNTGYFSQYPYSRDNLKINDFAGVIIVPYDDGQYSVWTEIVKAWNVKGSYYSGQDLNQNGIASAQDPGDYVMKDAGDYLGLNLVLKASGIGDGISDYLDDTNAFISFAYSKTYPKDNAMLGTREKKSGTSVWVGADMPGAADSDRWGFNYLHGSKYWRSMTYGEDTPIGSIAATRGDVYELYYHHQIIPHLTAGLRATYIRYKYTGSNSFFGDDGTPMDVDSTPTAIKKARDVRAYIRYKF